MEDDPRVSRLKVRINVFGNATCIARALGLDIELPGLDSTGPAHWDEIHRLGWKPSLRGKVTDPEEDGDPD